MTSSRVAAIAVVLFSLSACGDGGSTTATDPDDISVTTHSALTTTTPAAPSVGGQQGMGPDGALSQRHRAPIPAEYAGLTNPVPADDESLARGEAAYSVCATCHGDTGLGDGPAGAALQPAPVNIAHTSQMMSDAYLFWRITDGGVEFETVMPAWGTALDEQTRWDLINYIRALGEGTGPSGRGVGGGQGANPEAPAVEQAALLMVAVDQGLITDDEADVFAAAHATVDARMAEARATNPDETVDILLPIVLDELVAAGRLTQEESEAFLSVRDILLATGLLP